MAVRDCCRYLSDTPKRQRGQGQDICDFFGEGGDRAIRHIFSPEIFYQSPGASVCREKQSSPCRMFVLFYIGGNTRPGLVKSTPENIQPAEDLAYQLLPEHRCLVSALHCVLPSGDVEGQQLLEHMSGVDGKLTSLIMENDRFNVHLLVTKCQIPLVSMCYKKDRQMEKKKKMLQQRPHVCHCGGPVQTLPSCYQKLSTSVDGCRIKSCRQSSKWSRKGQPYCFARQRRPQQGSAAKQNKTKQNKQNGVPTPPRKCDGGFTAKGQTWGLARS